MPCKRPFSRPVTMLVCPQNDSDSVKRKWPSRKSSCMCLHPFLSPPDQYYLVLFSRAAVVGQGVLEHLLHAHLGDSLRRHALLGAPL